MPPRPPESAHCSLEDWGYHFSCLFLIQVAEKRNQSSDGSGATAHGSDSQPAAPVSTGDQCLLEPVGFNDQGDSAASPETQGDRTDSEPEKQPAVQESEQDTLIRQQLESREAGSVSAVGPAAKRGPSPGPAQRQVSCDGEEKRDQSKEEPPLEMKPQEG